MKLFCFFFWYLSLIDEDVSTPGYLFTTKALILEMLWMQNR